VHERLVLEEVQVSPRLLARVVRLAALRTTLRAGERTARLEIDIQIQLPRRRIELRARNAPRPGKVQGLLKQVGVTHVLILCRPSPLLLPPAAAVGRYGYVRWRSWHRHRRNVAIGGRSSSHTNPYCPRRSQPTQNSEEPEGSSGS